MLLAVAGAIVQLSVAALVIAAVVSSLALSLLLLAFHVRGRGRHHGAAGRGNQGVAVGDRGDAGRACCRSCSSSCRPAPCRRPASALVPVVGILAGNTMNGHTLTCRRAFAALREEKGQYEAALSLGLTRSAVGRRGGAPPGARGADPGTGPGAHGRRRHAARGLHRRAARRRLARAGGGGAGARAHGDHGRADDDGGRRRAAHRQRPAPARRPQGARCSPEPGVASPSARHQELQVRTGSVVVRT